MDSNSTFKQMPQSDYTKKLSGLIMLCENSAWVAYLEAWNQKTTKQVERELASMRRYVQKHSAHYSWHGANVSPGGIADGDKILILSEILRDRK